MRVSILCPNVSFNALGRSYLLARLLQAEYEVEILGPALTGGVWPPLAGQTDVPIRFVSVASPRDAREPLERLFDWIDGDAIYASKPFYASLGLGLRRRKQTHRPLVLDVDDWDLGIALQRLTSLSFPGKCRAAVRWPRRLRTIRTDDSAATLWFWERFVKRADALTVSNRFLQKRFGGVLLPHVRDTDWLDPAKYDAQEARRRWDVPCDARVVMFLGTARRHKGVEDLIEAVGMIPDPEVVLLVVGLEEGNRYCSALLERGRATLGARFLARSAQPFSELPRVLSMADVVAIPQRRTVGSAGQTPAKVFDAMAMAKPIVTTRVADLPEIAGGIGTTVEPGRPELLARGLKDALEDPARAVEQGRRARQRCIERYSLRAGREAVLPVFGRLLR